MFNFPNALLPPSNLLCEVRTIVIDSRSPKKNIPEKKIWWPKCLFEVFFTKK